MNTQPFSYSTFHENPTEAALNASTCLSSSSHPRQNEKLTSYLEIVDLNAGNVRSRGHHSRDWNGYYDFQEPASQNVMKYANGL